MTDDLTVTIYNVPIHLGEYLAEVVVNATVALCGLEPEDMRTTLVPADAGYYMLQIEPLDGDARRAFAQMPERKFECRRLSN